MLSNSSRYGIRAVIYLAGRSEDNNIIGINTISKDLNLPTPFLAKILQQLVRHKILYSVKGPHGGFSILRDPKKITLLDIVRIIEGEDIFNNCIIHNSSCLQVNERNEECILHNDYASIRKELVDFFSNRTIHELVKKANGPEKFVI